MYVHRPLVKTWGTECGRRLYSSDTHHTVSIWDSPHYLGSPTWSYAPVCKICYTRSFAIIYVVCNVVYCRNLAEMRKFELISEYRCSITQPRGKYIVVCTAFVLKSFKVSLPIVSTSMCVHHNIIYGQTEAVPWHWMIGDIHSYKLLLYSHGIKLSVPTCIIQPHRRHTCAYTYSGLWRQCMVWAECSEYYTTISKGCW